MRDAYEESREDSAVNEQNYLGDEVEPSEFLDKMTRQAIHRLILAQQEQQAYELVKACELTARQANENWERICAQLNALGDSVN